METDELIFRLEHGWKSPKAEKLKLLHAISSTPERRARIERIINLSASREIRDSLLNNHVMLAPSPKEVCESGEIVLGDVCFGRNPDGSDKMLYELRQSFKDARAHCLISGSTGTGKTTLAYNVAIQLAQKGITVIAFDWHRSWRTLLSLDEKKYPFVKDIRVYTVGRDIHPYRGNLFFGGPEHLSMRHWLGTITGTPLQKSLLSGLGSSGLLETEAEKLIGLYESGSLKLRPNAEDMKRGIEKLFLGGRKGLWLDTANRVLSALLRPNVREVFSSRNPVDFVSDVLDRPGITIFEMDMEFPNHLRILLQEQIIMITMLTLLSRGESEELKTALFLEEFQHLIPSRTEQEIGSDLVGMLFREGRKFGLAVWAISQSLSDISHAVVSNCRTQIHFPTITFRDVSAVSNALFLKPMEIRFIDYLKMHQALCAIKMKTKNALLQTRPAPTMRKVTDEELKELAKQW